MEAEAFECGGGDAAAFVLSRLPHPDDAAAGARAAYVDAATGRELSFAGLRRAALSLASALRLGLGLRRGDAVLVLLPPDDDPLLVPPLLLGVLAAGCVLAVAAEPDAKVAATAAIVVGGPGSAGAAPLLLTSRSPDPRTLSAEELMDGGDPAALDAVAADRPNPWDTALVVHSSSRSNVAMTHAELITTVAGAAFPDDGRVCLATLPAWGTSINGGLALLALGLPAAGATMVLLPPSCDLRAAVAAHGATDVVAAPEAAAALFAPALPQGKLATLRRVTVVTPLTDDAHQALRHRLPWVDLVDMSDTPRMGATTPESPEQVAPPLLGQPEAAATQMKGKIPDQMPTINEATSPVAPLQKIQKTVFGQVFAKSVAGKFLRNPVACDKQAVSKL